MALPNAAHTARRDKQPALLEFIAYPYLSERRLFGGKGHHSLLNFLTHSVLQQWLLAANLLQACLSAALIKLLEPIKAIAAVAHDFAGFTDIAQRFCQLQQAQFVLDNLLLVVHSDTSLLTLSLLDVSD